MSKIAIITGGSRGIGRDTVLRLARRGVRTLFTYNSNRADADKVAALAALLSDDFGWVNAQRIEVAGGMQI